MAAGIDWLRHIFHRPERRDVTDDIRDAAAELRQAALALNQKLARYNDAEDPFTLILADIYERRQEALIYKEALKDWHGPPE